jgi:hypothetical protein
MLDREELLAQFQAAKGRLAAPKECWEPDCKGPVREASIYCNQHERPSTGTPPTIFFDHREP